MVIVYLEIFLLNLICLNSIGGGKVERIKSTVSTDRSTSDTSQQVGFFSQMARKSEHSGLNENVPDTQDAKKTEGTSEVTSSKGNALLLSKCPPWSSGCYCVTPVL